MKKLLLLFCALLCLGGSRAWAQGVVTDYASAGSPVTYSTYVASAGTGAKYAFMTPSENAATLHKWVGFNRTVGNVITITRDHLFVLENSDTDGKYWLKRFSNSQYLAGDNTFSSDSKINLTLVNRRAGDYASEYSNSNLHISFDNDGGNHFNNGNGNYNFAVGTGGWSTCIAYGPYYIAEVNYLDDEGNPLDAPNYHIVKDGTTISYTTEPANIGVWIRDDKGSVTVNGADVVLNCTYHFPETTYQYQISDASGVIYTSDYYVGTAGDEISTLPSAEQRSYCKYTVTSKTLETGKNIVAVSVTWDGPFDISSDFASAKWYYLMQSHQEETKNYVSHSSGNPCPVSGTKPTTDNGLWAFIGNPYDGFKIINKAAGDGKYLEATANNPTMTTTQTAWVIANRSGFDAAYFNIHSGSTNYINMDNDNHVLKYWNSGSAANDNNSTFRVEEYSEDFTSEVATYITPYFDTHGEYFSITDAAYTENHATWTAAKTSCNKATYNSLRSIVESNINYPADGWYLIKNYSTENYINTTGTTSAVTNTNNAPSSIVYLDNRGDGTCYILSQGGYFQTPSVGYNVTRSSTPVAFTPEVATATVVSFKAGSYGLADSGGVLRGGYLRGTASDPASYWTVEDISSITASITNAKDNTSAEHSYATLCVPFAISALSGANAYMPTVSDGYVVLGDAATVSDGTLIPAGTPVILVGAKDAGTYTATIKSGTASVTSPVAPSGSNVLTGIFASTSINCAAESTNYVLGFDEDNDNRIGFYHVDGGSSFALSANRAYLNTSAYSVKGFAINFGDIVDDIKSLSHTPSPVSERSIFNLAGQRMSRVQKGVNIINGKKVIVK